MTEYHLLLFDGVCGLCNGLVKLILKQDKKGVFRFAPLQSQIAAELLKRHQLNASQLSTVYVVVNYREANEHLKYKADAAIFVLGQLGGLWKAISVLRIFPNILLNWGYDFIAKNRYKWFGRYDTCMMPDPSYQTRFIED